jgi:hypothetical protein
VSPKSSLSSARWTFGRRYSAIYRIAQTSVARLNSIVLRADREKRPTYHLLADSTCSAYMLACLKDAAEELGGRVKDAGTLPS